MCPFLVRLENDYDQGLAVVKVTAKAVKVAVLRKALFVSTFSTIFFIFVF